MPEQNARRADGRSTMAAGITTAAAIAAALGWLAAIKIKKAEAAPPDEVPEIPEIPGIPEELVALIIAIAASADAVDTNTAATIDAIKALALEGGLGWPPNAPGIRSFAKVCIAAAQFYQGDDMAVPDGMNLLIKSFPTNAVGSLIRVASTPADCTNPNSSWPLIPNEPVAYAVKNANEIYISSNIAGSIAIFSCERKA